MDLLHVLTKKSIYWSLCHWAPTKSCLQFTEIISASCLLWLCHPEDKKMCFLSRFQPMFVTKKHKLEWMLTHKDLPMLVKVLTTTFVSGLGRTSLILRGPTFWAHLGMNHKQLNVSYFSPRIVEISNFIVVKDYIVPHNKKPLGWLRIFSGSWCTPASVALICITINFSLGWGSLIPG